jgi:hypothetical protein
MGTTWDTARGTNQETHRLSTSCEIPQTLRTRGCPKPGLQASGGPCKDTHSTLFLGGHALDQETPGGQDGREREGKLLSI